MPAERQVGMDQPHYRFSALPTRPPLAWPGGAPVALAVIVLVEHVELDPPTGWPQIALPGVAPRSAMGKVSLREYGHRVGIFRVLDELAAHRIRPTVAIDAMAAERYPTLVANCVSRGAELVAHGIAATRPITNAMPENVEQAYLAAALERIEAATGTRPTGWLSVEQSESERTPRLLDQLGMDYVCDWPNDDQPYVMDTPNQLVSVPTTFALDDAYLLDRRSTRPDFYATSIVRCFEKLADEGTTSGRSLVLVVRPWLVGVPFRMVAFSQALETVMGSGRAWAVSTGEIARAFRAATG